MISFCKLAASGSCRTPREPSQALSGTPGKASTPGRRAKDVVRRLEETKSEISGRWGVQPARGSWNAVWAPIVCGAFGERSQSRGPRLGGLTDKTSLEWTPRRQLISENGRELLLGAS